MKKLFFERRFNLFDLMAISLVVSLSWAWIWLIIPLMLISAWGERKFLQKAEEEIYLNPAITKKDAYAIKTCLDYAWHRLTQHKNTGIHGIISRKRVNRLRKELL